jgi:hypothetical protein
MEAALTSVTIRSTLKTHPSKKRIEGDVTSIKSCLHPSLPSLKPDIHTYFASVFPKTNSFTSTLHSHHAQMCELLLKLYTCGCLKDEKHKITCSDNPTGNARNCQLKTFIIDNIGHNCWSCRFQKLVGKSQPP